MPVSRLSAAMRRDSNAVHQLKLRLAGVDGIPVETSDRCYRLDPEAVSVDVREFVAGVDRAGPDTPVDELDRLAQMWTGDPVTHHPEVAETTWQPVLRRLHRLAGLLAAVPEERRPDSAAELERLRPQDRALWQLRRSPRPKKLLIVDDTAADELGERLEGRYRTVRLTTLAQWRAFRDTPELYEVDGALVDLHLHPEGRQEGLEIIEYLCRRTEIPTALISAHPPADIGTPRTRFMPRHRLVRVLPKGLESRTLYESLDDVVRDLVDDEPRHQLIRLQVWLDHAVHRLEASRAHPRNRDQGAASWLAARRAAQQAIDTHDLELARRLVQDFCRRQ